MEALSCPFCGFSSDTDYGIMYHMEMSHPEGVSSFSAEIGFKENEETSDHGLDPVECLREGCGEVIMLSELESHMSMHDVENGHYESVPCLDYRQGQRTSNSEPPRQCFDITLSSALRNLDDQKPARNSSSNRQARAKETWKQILNMPGPRSELKPTMSSKHPRRLGKADLGPFAHEKQMPARLLKILEADGKGVKVTEPARPGVPAKVRIIENQVSGIVKVVEQLLGQDKTTEYAILCHPCVQHVSKLQKEGGFCGYRNIQMMVSYINGAESQGFEHFHARLPTILQIQDFIEQAWDFGINEESRLETGGLRGTRKYIGTPEAQAMFLSLGIACDCRAFENGKSHAFESLMQYAEEYYSKDCLGSKKVRSTTLAPLYFQYPGHSMTIIGFEKRNDGSKNLLVFDPMFHDSSEIIQHVGRDFSCKNSEKLLRAYRRSATQLRRYKAFETLRLTPPRRILS